MEAKAALSTAIERLPVSQGLLQQGETEARSLPRRPGRIKSGLSDLITKEAAEGG
jgi:hypothetical protein